MVTLQAIAKEFLFHKRRLMVLEDVDFKIEEGHFACLVGRSGSGKTTLLNIISGLVRPTAGTVLYDGRETKHLFDLAAARFRSQNIGFVFQHFDLISYHTVLENVIVPLKFSSLPPRAHREKGLRLLEEMGIADKRDHYPHLLSGGQMQRTAIARALIKGPKLILADEPTGNLDDSTAREIIEIFTRLNEDQNVAFLIATHDHEIIAKCRPKYRLEDRRLTRFE